ncbi:uncharacterized protein BXZ73DRAFT_79016 [Epithele typhae]|uniref:uncharacterized protein n=1 Tax=Epithele typhae TaxID=378194 RepID=UPI002008EB73|nr:uncharacterized protein BXZ73DRAFT_79016 [Epithele typhae]KAH9925346.1 hypothetical protein BXZ73DRAFT_79016 [Epithele typhae]
MPRSTHHQLSAPSSFSAWRSDPASQNPPLDYSGIVRASDTPIGQEPRLSWSSQLHQNQTLRRTALTGLGSLTNQCFEFQGTIYRMGDWLIPELPKGVYEPAPEQPVPPMGGQWLGVVMDYSVNWIWTEGHQIQITHGHPDVQVMRVVGISWTYGVHDIRQLLVGKIPHHEEIAVNNPTEEATLQELLNGDTYANTRYFSDEVEWFPLTQLMDFSLTAKKAWHSLPTSWTVQRGLRFIKSLLRVPGSASTLDQVLFVDKMVKTSLAIPWHLSASTTHKGDQIDHCICVTVWHTWMSRTRTRTRTRMRRRRRRRGEEEDEEEEEEEEEDDDNNNNDDDMPSIEGSNDEGDPQDEPQQSKEEDEPMGDVTGSEGGMDM